MNNNDELFTNTQLDLTQLPQADTLQMIPLEKDYKVVRCIGASIFAITIIIISWFVVLLKPGHWPIGNILAIIISLISIWIIWYHAISFHYMGYAVRQKDISFKSGWLWRSMTTVPFNRVQHCDIKQGLIDRWFGLSKLTIYTAGGQSTDLMIPGLLPETAERLKAYILKSTELSVEED
jgi:membrane protein YdbS with pleckstrin-like domain